MLAAALLLAQAAPTASAGEAVGELFRNACILGEIRLGRDRAKVIKRSQIPPGIRDLVQGGWFAASKSPVKSLNVIKVSDPPETYLVMASYRVDKPDRRNPTSSCTVLSKSISLEQAQSIFQRADPQARLDNPQWDGPTIRQWRQFHPEGGYTLTLKIVESKWIVLETTAFPAATIR
jgi:hypothetical protein